MTDHSPRWPKRWWPELSASITRAARKTHGREHTAASGAHHVQEVGGKASLSVRDRTTYDESAAATLGRPTAVPW